MRQSVGEKNLSPVRGWVPPGPLRAPPLFVWPPQLGGLLKSIFGFPGYVWPWNAGFMCLATITWLLFSPDMVAMKHFAPGWVALIFLENLVLVLLVVGAWHIRLYTHRAQGTEYKYNDKWLATDNRNFLFQSQVLDNLFWTIVSAVPIWTAFEVVMLWAQANNWAPVVTWRQHPIYCTALLLSIPTVHEVHFYVIHRLLHWRPLYSAVHSLHHKNVNTGPWSGLAMHPLEHLLYFSGIFLFFILPASPLHTIYFLQNAALTPSKGHSGFGRLKVGSARSLDNDHYTHYLHHKYFEVNYGGDGFVPMDKWFGSFHDGSSESQEAMIRRIQKRRAVVKSRATGLQRF